MKVTLYTREGSAECERVWVILSTLAERENFELCEAPSPEGAPAPCIRFAAPGAPFYNAVGLSEPQFKNYLNAARHLTKKPETAPLGGVSKAKKAGSLPTAAYESTHPVRSFLWRHRVGALISSLSAFVGLAWASPLTVSLGLGNGFYNAIHSAYRLVCDQVPERSAQMGGLPVCLCWRCTAIYMGALLMGILYTVARDRKIKGLKWLLNPISLPVMLLYGLPLILDGATHTLGLRPGATSAQSTDFWLSWGTFSADWWMRIATSLLATVGAVKFLCPRLDRLGFAYEKLYEVRVRTRGRGLAELSPNSSV